MSENAYDMIERARREINHDPLPEPEVNSDGDPVGASREVTTDQFPCIRGELVMGESIHVNMGDRITRVPLTSVDADGNITYLPYNQIMPSISNMEPLTVSAGYTGAPTRLFTMTELEAENDRLNAQMMRNSDIIDLMVENDVTEITEETVNRSL